jgi:hypothetical protein
MLSLGERVTHVPENEDVGDSQESKDAHVCVDDDDDDDDG